MTSALVISLAFLCLAQTVDSKGKICKPGRKYFDPLLERCKRCQQDCPNGQTINTSYPLNISEEFGALDCYPCVDCPNGEYSNGDTLGTCQSCYDCEKMENRYIISRCNGKKDAKCGDCFPMFYEMTTIKGIGPCLKCTESNADKPNCIKSMMETQSSDARNTGITTVGTSPSSSSAETTTPGYIGNFLNHVSGSVLILVILVCIAVFLIFLFGVYKLYKCLHQTCSGYQLENFGTTSTLASTSSNGRFISLQKIPDYQGLPQDDLETDCGIADLTADEENIKLHLDDMYINITSRFLDACPKKLYDNLDIDGGRRYSAKCRHENNPMEEIVELLKHWVSRESVDAKLGRLYRALREGGYILACQKVLETLRKGQESVV